MNEWRKEMKELLVAIEKWYSKQPPVSPYQKAFVWVLLLGSIAVLILMLLYH